MPIPDFQSLMLPVLEFSSRGEVKISEVVQELGARLGLSEADLSELLPSGKQTKFANRVNWAKSYLGKAGLVNLTKRAHFKISDLGHQVLISPPPVINIKFLESFPNFQNFRAAGSLPDKTIDPPSENLKDLTPDEIIRAAYENLNRALSDELLNKVRKGTPEFFERMVVQLLVKMGYGGSAVEAGRAMGKSGDNGIDGVIDQDALGLDRVYIQAKKYAADNTVSSGAIRDFFGALDRHKAAKGLFVTTSSFTSSARETADMLSKRIVMIDGPHLARLMIRYEIGCRVEETISLKQLDEEFFE